MGCAASPNPGFSGGDSQGDATASGAGPGGVGGGTPGDDGGQRLVIGGDSGAADQTSPSSSSMNIRVDDCPGALTAAVASALQAGGTIAGSMKWLYPYDRTVFPGGILAPTLQWSQPAGPDAVYVHLHSQRFDYKGCFAGTQPPQLPIPQSAWDAAWAQGAGASDPLTVELTTSTGGSVSGPIAETWTFARGSLKAVVYYNTYTSQIAGNNGSVMQIAPGAATPTTLIALNGVLPIGPCVSCHSVSANGQYLVAQRHFYVFGGSNGSGLLDSESYGLGGGATLNTSSPLAQVPNDDWGFSAMYPDGSRLLTNGQANQTNPPFPGAAGNNPGMIGPNTSKMYDPRTGASIPSSGLASKYAMMPMFSPDGKKVVFNDYDHGTGHSLAVQNFDAASNGFSNAVTIFQDPNLYPGWPFFTPDSRQVIFVLGDGSNFATIHDPPAGTQVAKSDLYIVDLAGGAAHPLDGANGYLSGQSYLPYPGRDEHLNYYPTVSPVGSGGYFWVYFTSRRNYGNTNVVAATDSKSKKIWVAPIEISETGLATSHPAFYLPGQELVSGNIRAFAALEPCKADGLACSSGIDCCGGACTDARCGAPKGCSKLDERCAVASDCCDATQQCIGGFCAQPTPK